MTDLSGTTVLFDWNGTIVLDADRARLALNGVLGPRGLPTLDQVEFRERFQLPMRALFAALGVSESELERSEAEWNHGMLGGEPLARDGASVALAHLSRSGARFGVVSAAAEPSIRADLAALGLAEHGWTLIRGAVSDKAAVLDAERGDSPVAVYVGDTEYDIESARAAGFRAVGVDNGYTTAARLIEAGAEWIVDSLADLLPILAALQVRTPQPLAPLLHDSTKGDGAS